MVYYIFTPQETKLSKQLITFPLFARSMRVSVLFCVLLTNPFRVNPTLKTKDQLHPSKQAACNAELQPE